MPLFQQESLWYNINLIANIVAFSKNQLRLCPEAVKSQIFTRSWVWGATEKDKTWLNRLISCRPEIRLWSVGPVPASLRQHQKSFRHTRICSLLSFHYSHLFRSHVWIRLQCQLKTIWFKPIWKRFFGYVRWTFRKRASRHRFFFYIYFYPWGARKGTFWRIIISFQSGTENID